jgi:hypothetical protein
MAAPWPLLKAAGWLVLLVGAGQVGGACWQENQANHVYFSVLRCNDRSFG